jgi:hypothetical protein
MIKENEIVVDGRVVFAFTIDDDITTQQYTILRDTLSRFSRTMNETDTEFLTLILPKYVKLKVHRIGKTRRTKDKKPSLKRLIRVDNE